MTLFSDTYRLRGHCVIESRLYDRDGRDEPLQGAITSTLQNFRGCEGAFFV